ncbi:MAG: hypothetical protein D6746_08610 [Bacteroidetes bacterium]|nr:MAG: hypothetical protein D6746_08610 [Bacteroidota bacterium]
MKDWVPITVHLDKIPDHIYHHYGDTVITKWMEDAIPSRLIQQRVTQEVVPVQGGVATLSAQPRWRRAFGYHEGSFTVDDVWRDMALMRVKVVGYRTGLRIGDCWIEGYRDGKCIYLPKDGSLFAAYTSPVYDDSGALMVYSSDSLGMFIRDYVESQYLHEIGIRDSDYNMLQLHMRKEASMYRWLKAAVGDFVMDNFDVDDFFNRFEQRLSWSKKK